MKTHLIHTVIATLAMILCAMVAAFLPSLWQGVSGRDFRPWGAMMAILIFIVAAMLRAAVEARVSEPTAVGVALLIIGITWGAGIYVLLTGFYPRWRKTLRWARGWWGQPTGPPLSLYSHAASAAFWFTAPWAICSDGFAFRPWLTTGIHVLAGVTSALMIGG